MALHTNAIFEQAGASSSDYAFSLNKCFKMEDIEAGKQDQIGGLKACHAAQLPKQAMSKFGLFSKHQI